MTIPAPHSPLPRWRKISQPNPSQLWSCEKAHNFEVREILASGSGWGGGEYLYSANESHAGGQCSLCCVLTLSPPCFLQHIIFLRELFYGTTAASLACVLSLSFSLYCDIYWKKPQSVDPFPPFSQPHWCRFNIRTCTAFELN